MEEQVKIKTPKLPFKLCFMQEREIGRSYFQTGKPLNVVKPLAPKFYISDKKPDVDLSKGMEKLRMIGPKEKYCRPITENQCYGWYELKLDRNERLNFARKTGQMVKDNLMNFAKIRDFAEPQPQRN